MLYPLEFIIHPRCVIISAREYTMYETKIGNNVVKNPQKKATIKALENSNSRKFDTKIQGNVI